MARTTARLEITADDLRAALSSGASLTVLDVRPAAERAEWSIPGSIHVDAYERLRAGDPSALDATTLPGDRPVVVVCAAGRTSLLAVDQLRARGIEAVSLAGGMKAWSLAWNVAEVPLAAVRTRVLQVRRTGKGCLSYLVANAGEALVVDAALDPRVYLELAEREGLRIVAVADTHVHADHLSRSRTLAAQAGAPLYVPEQRRVAYATAPLGDGSELRVGRAIVRVLHTPGHTGESVCYFVDGRALLTGDTLFLTGVGRPDLEASAGEARERAHALYHSLRRLVTLPEDVLVLPGHTSEPVPFDNHPIAAPLTDVRGAVAMLDLPEDAFVATVLARIPPTPPNHHQIVLLNEAGTLPAGDVTDLEAGANRCAVA